MISITLFIVFTLLMWVMFLGGILYRRPLPGRPLHEWERDDAAEFAGELTNRNTDLWVQAPSQPLPAEKATAPVGAAFNTPSGTRVCGLPAPWLEGEPVWE